MIFDPASAPHLKPWLVRTLEPICDAEPGALADYILALLKHNVPENEMRKELSSQLEEFLEKECPAFIETLFTVLRTKSYLPYNPPSPPPPSADEGIPIPLDSLMPGASGPSSERTRKRSASSDERDGRPKKGPRLGNEGDFSRFGNGGPQAGWGGPQQFGEFPGGMDAFGMQMNPMAMGMAMNGMAAMGARWPQGYQPPGQKRGICRDYHNHGFCARGDMCKYSHGEGAVVPSQLYPMNMPLNFLYNMFNNANAPYDPNDPQAARQNQRVPLLPRVEDGSRVMHPTNAAGELPVIQDLTPKLPPDETRKQQQNGQPSSQHDRSAGPPAGNGFDPSMFPGMPNFNGMPQFPGMQMPMQMGEPGPRPAGGFRGRGGNRGGRGGNFGAEASQHRPGRKGDKTLVVEKIPSEKLSREELITWFKKFGDVTNVAVDFGGAKALVSFGTHEEAHAAWKSEDAVFGNRFVKVFWHRPMEGHGQLGQRALAASATLVANLKGDNVTPSGSSTSVVAPQVAASTSGSSKKTSAASALAAKQELLEKQIAEQKSLMASLSTAKPEEKKTIMARLRKLGEEMQAASSSTTTPTPPAKAASPAVDAEEKERQRLDKELETNGAGEGDETTEQLKAKLEKLKAEAASLGIDSGSEPPYGGGYRGGFRGRARGRGFYRGGLALRGGPPRGSLKLDNRPKKLVVKDVSGDEGLRAVKEFYEVGGQVESVESADGGDVVVSFRTRAAAEQALSKGSILPTIGKVSVSWYTAAPKQGTSSVPSSSTPATAAVSPLQKPKELSAEPAEPEDAHHTHDHHEEHVVSSGWGDDEDMGMQ